MQIFVSDNRSRERAIRAVGRFKATHRSHSFGKGYAGKGYARITTYAQRDLDDLIVDQVMEVKCKCGEVLEIIAE